MSDEASAQETASWLTPKRILAIAVVTVLTVALSLLWTGGVRAWPNTVSNGYAPYKFPATREQPFWDSFTFLGTSGSGYDSESDYTVGVQRELRYLGYYPGPNNDGLFGLQTRSAVQAFQHDTGLPETGNVGDGTWFYLMVYAPYDYSASGYDYHRIYGTYGTNYWRHNQSTDRWGIRNKDNAYWVSWTANGPN